MGLITTEAHLAANMWTILITFVFLCDSDRPEGEPQKQLIRVTEKTNIWLILSRQELCEVLHILVVVL